TIPTQTYTLSLHDALPISQRIARRHRYRLAHRRLHVAHRGAQVAPTDVDVDPPRQPCVLAAQHRRTLFHSDAGDVGKHDLLATRSEEHTSELQSRRDLVCR